jgi:hypothetical protein
MISESKLMPNDLEYSVRIDLTRYALKEARKCLEVMHKYSPNPAIRRQERYIERLELQLTLYSKLQSGS